MHFTPLERDILNWIAHHTDEPNIAAQIRAAQPISRKFTGHGSFTQLQVTEEYPPVTVRISPLDPSIESPDLAAGGGCVLFFENGRAATLEIYCNGDDAFPETLSSWKLI